MPNLLRLPEAASLGLHAAVLLAANSNGPLSAHELAARLHASEAHLAKVMQRLVKAGLLDSTRGPKGGFVLAKPADQISLLAVYEAVEGIVEPTTCVFGTAACGRKSCIFGGFVERFDKNFRDYLANAKLRDLASPEESLNAHP